jgi:threonine/homoserine/homoserine lactone efflux protein
MRAALFTALALGLPAGVAPGPLLTLVVTHTLRHGLRAGALVAAAPLITDPPIVVLCVWLLSGSTATAMLPWLSIAGGLFVVWLGYGTLRASADRTGASATAPHALRDGILVNALSPHPYLFWMTVGGPLVVTFNSASPARGLAFVTVFLTLVVAGKVILAAILERSRGWLEGAGYRWLLRAMGALLIAMGLWLVVQGVGTLTTGG